MAKKMPMFEPERVEAAATEEKPLVINLELALYRVKVLTRNFQFQGAEMILQKMDDRMWPLESFCVSSPSFSRLPGNTRRESLHLAVLGCPGNKVGNIRWARELFDAATVADKRHVAAWHGWAVLEVKEGNVKKARNLLGKGLKYCGGNEHIYQSLALLEAKANQLEQARYLFQQATKCNPKSCASWLAWAQVEMQQENNHAARQLFESYDR